MEPEIIFGESLRGSDSKKLRREVYETVEHINNVHPTKITKVVVYINGKGEFVTELWSGVHYSKQSVGAGDDVSAERGILYAHLRVSAKASARMWPNAVNSSTDRPTLYERINNIEQYSPYLRKLWREQDKAGRDAMLKHQQELMELIMTPPPITYTPPTHKCRCVSVKCMCGALK